MRQFFLVTHRWVGIAAALILFFVGLTGVLLVWSDGEGLAYWHTHLGIGEPGEWLVNSATMASVFLIIGGIVLWWRRKIVRLERSKGWWRFLFDLHHAFGIIAAVGMLVIALSGSGLMMTEGVERAATLPIGDPGRPAAEAIRLREWIRTAHTGGGLMAGLGVLWALGSAGFVLQAVSGVLMWWKPQKGARPD